MLKKSNGFQKFFKWLQMFLGCTGLENESQTSLVFRIDHCQLSEVLKLRQCLKRLWSCLRFWLLFCSCLPLALFCLLLVLCLFHLLQLPILPVAQPLFWLHFFSLGEITSFYFWSTIYILAFTKIFILPVSNII